MQPLQSLLLSVVILLLLCTLSIEAISNSVHNNNMLRVRVASYNVLSSQLCSPDHFTACAPENLDAKGRLSKVLKKLEQEVATKSIIALQEVSYEWAGHFHTFFANRGYHLITGLYGKKFNGYMGIALAVPMDEYELESVDVERLSDHREGGWPRDPKKNNDRNMITKLLVDVPINYIWKPVTGLFYKKGEDEYDHWSKSEWRFNVLLYASLKSKNCGKVFGISNYHMPCAFYAPMIMNIHSDLVVKRTQDLSGSKPCILAGDFNITPDSAHYKLITTGMLNPDDPTFPSPSQKDGTEFAVSIKEPMRSAYAVCKGEEPNFTNYAIIRDGDPFIDVLDYIFLSSEWKVNKVQELPHRDDVNGPLPTKDEPSDHVLIAADLEL